MIYLATDITAFARAARGAPAAPGARPARICVVGVGGAGCNAVEHMIRRGIDGVDFIAVNSDAGMLAASAVDRRILIPRGQTRTGNRADELSDIGGRAARQALPQIRSALSGAAMCFIAAGMGGGTGTGATAVIAAAARAMGILTVAVVTRPFVFEGQRRRRLADSGIAALRRSADTLIVMPNQKLLLATNDGMPMRAAFRATDEMLEQGVRSIADLIVRPGIVNVDVADVRAVMQGMGKAVLGTGEASGPRRALDAAERAMANRLIDGALDGARNLLISIVGGDDMRLAEIGEAADAITRRVHPDATIIWGSAHDARLGGRIRVSVVATGIGGAVPAPSAALPFACRLGRHGAPLGTTFNQGFHFGACPDCGRDLIRSGAAWRHVPRGFRVVWRDAHEAGARATQPPAPPRGQSLARRLSDQCGVLRAAACVLAWHYADRIQGRRPPARV